MAEAGIGLIVMDDGLQHTSLAQDLRLVVVDGAAGFGNGRPIPAGPLRETVEAGIARADALIVMGEDEKGLAERFRGRLPVLGASVAIKDAAGLADRTVLGFAGIGRPSKFRASLAGAGARIADFREFPDHYPYDDAELDALAAEAEALDAQLVTTEKDWVRLSPPWRARIAPVSVAVAWRDEAALAALLGRLARHG
jgi:tetraacyldisaccharide 4'-kinase